MCFINRTVCSHSLTQDIKTRGTLNKEDSICVVGHNGLVGSSFLRRLETEGYLNVITRGKTELDLTNQRDVDAFIIDEKPKYLILAAGRVGGIIQNRDYPADFIRENLSMQVNVLTSAKNSGVDKLIFFGSSCMYPKHSPQPMSEEMLFTGKPEETSIAYATAKLAGVEMCLALNRQFKETKFLPVIPNTIYGPNDNFNPASSHVIPALIRRFHEAKQNSISKVELWGTGSPRRESIYVDDVVDACMSLLSQDVANIEFPLNIGVGVDYSIKEMAQIISEIVGYKGEFVFDTSKPDGAPRKLLDSSKIVATGWNSQATGLEEGVRKTYEWFLQNGARKVA